MRSRLRASPAAPLGAAGFTPRLGLPDIGSIVTLVLTTMLALAAAALISSPRLVPVLALLAAVLACVAAIVARPELPIGLALVVIGTYQLSDDHPFHVGSISVYSTDVLLVLLVLRALTKRDRFPGGFRLHPLIAALAGILGLLLVYADWRGRAAGLPTRSLVRMAMALVYYPGYVFGFSRLLRERALDPQRLYRFCGTIGLAFVAFMLVSRGIGKTFDTSSSFALDSHGYKVVTADGTLLRRDYGFPSAFIVYPVMALAALAYALYGRRVRGAAWLAGASVVATLLTLIRGEIFGLLLGVAALYFAAPRSSSRRLVSRRVPALVFATIATVAGAAVIAVSSPTLASGLAQRMLPGLVAEGTYAQKTANDRLNALSTGYHFAVEHPLGAGFRSFDTLAAETGVDPLFVTHSTPAFLLVYVGWPGAITALALFVGAVAASFLSPAREAWHHPAFVAVLCLFFVYSFSAFGLVGQPWVMTIATLAIALRFTRRGDANEI